MTKAKERALVALMTTRTMREAAEAAGVGYRTLRRWTREDPEFMAEYRALTDDAFVDATRRLAKLNDTAITVIEEIVCNAAEKPVLRHQAARSILEYSGKLQEVNDILTRLEALESENNRH